MAWLPFQKTLSLSKPQTMWLPCKLRVIKVIWLPASSNIAVIMFMWTLKLPLICTLFCVIKTIKKRDLETYYFTINGKDMSLCGMTRLMVLLVFSSIFIFINMIRPNKHNQTQKKNFSKSFKKLCIKDIWK